MTNCSFKLAGVVQKLVFLLRDLNKTGSETGLAGKG